MATSIAVKTVVNSEKLAHLHHQISPSLLTATRT